MEMAGKFRIFCDDCPTKQQAINKEALSTTTTTSTSLAATHKDNGNHQPPTQTLATSKGEPLQPHHAAKGDPLQAYHNAKGEPIQPVGAKREPLGLRQAMSQASAALVELQTAGPANSSSSSSSLTEEDQENDISMASLGSDFVPSIVHEDDFDDRSFEVEDDDNGPVLELTDDFDDDFEDEDEEFQMELAQAFKEHDEVQLFNSTVYIDDIKSYLVDLERKPKLRPLPNYMDLQKDIDSNKRAILINWLVEVSDEYNLNTETLFICIGIIDRFLSSMSISTSNFQLLGVAAMFIASKYEEIYPPTLYNFIEVTDDTYSGPQICQMEQEILKTLDFRISLPTVTFFLRQIFAFHKLPKKVFHLAEYLCYLSLIVDDPILEYYPSEIALAAVILAAHQLDATASIPSDLKSGYDNSNLNQLNRRKLPKGVSLKEIDRRSYIINEKSPFCIEALRALQEDAFNRSTKTTYTAIVQKFSSANNSCVALLRPPKVEDLYSI